MLGFLLLFIIYPLVLLKLPWVKSKGFLPALIVSVLTAAFQFVLFFFTAPISAAVAVVGAFIPFLGGFLVKIAFFIISLLLHSISLHLADRLIGSFEIAGFTNVIKTAFLLSVISNVFQAIF